MQENKCFVQMFWVDLFDKETTKGTSYKKKTALTKEPPIAILHLGHSTTVGISYLGSTEGQKLSKSGETPKNIILKMATTATAINTYSSFLPELLM